MKEPVEMDLGLLYEALAAGRIDVAVGGSTDGRLARGEFRALIDDARAFPPYDAVPIARGARFDAQPEALRALRDLGGSLDALTMARLNAEVDGEHADPRIVARRWLDGTAQPPPAGASSGR
jgi:glycine betaine/choline ABC-type transport system substrate-binding protein